MAKSVTPKPVVVKTICSMCGLDWDDHGDSPTTEDCIRLLKVEAAKQRSCGCYHWHWQGTYTYPYWQVNTAGANTQISYTSGLQNQLNTAGAVNYSTPAISSATLSSTSV